MGHFHGPDDKGRFGVTATLDKKCILPLDQLGFVDFQKNNNFGQQNTMPACSTLFHITYGVANSAIILGLILVAKSFERPSDIGGTIF
jgi:hypothetical protein